MKILKLLRILLYLLPVKSKLIIWFSWLFIFVVHCSLLIVDCNAQCKIGFTQTPQSNYYCTSSAVVALEALDTNQTGGCLYTPGLIIYIQLDANSINEDYFTLYENGKNPITVSGVHLGNNVFKFIKSELSTTSTYSLKWCDIGKSGTFTYKVYDRNKMALIANGIFIGSDSCTTIVLSKLTGTARFSGPGVTNDNDGKGTFDPSVAGPGVHTIKYYWNNGQGFADSVTQTDTVRPAPVIVLNDTNLCPGLNGILTAKAKGAKKYLWSIGSTSQSISVPPLNFTYTVNITDSLGCIGTKSVKVKTLPKPTHFLQKEVTLCNNSTIALRCIQKFRSYLWQDGDTTQSIIIKTPGNYKLTVTDSSGCKGTDSSTVINNCPPILYVPGAFKPDELPPINNTFYPRGSNIINYHMYIYNRWGVQVFHSDDLEIGWDGTYNNAYCPGGVYVYIIRYEGEIDGTNQKLTKKGTITLLR